MCSSLSTSECSAQALSLRSHSSESTLCQEKKRESEKGRRLKVNPIMQVAGTNESNQKMSVEWLAGLKVVAVMQIYNYSMHVFSCSNVHQINTFSFMIFDN